MFDALNFMQSVDSGGVVSGGGHRFRRGRIQAMFEQRRHVALDGFELVQLQVRIGNGEHVAGPGLFVNEHALAVA